MSTDNNNIAEKASRKTEPVKQLVIGFIALLVIVLAAALLAIIVINSVSSGLFEAIKVLSTLDAAIIVALITGTISILTVVIGSIINNAVTYKMKKEEYLRSHRESPYKKLISLFYDFQAQTKLGEELSPETIIKAHNDFTKELALWGSPKAIRIWGEWRVKTGKVNPSPNDTLFGMEKVIIQLRKDMGQKHGIKQGDILRLTVNDIDDQLPSNQKSQLSR